MDKGEGGGGEESSYRNCDTALVGSGNDCLVLSTEFTDKLNWTR